jgi:hypothetical protein
MNYYYLAYIHGKLRDNRIYVKDFNNRTLIKDFSKDGGIFTAKDPGQSC